MQGAGCSTEEVWCNWPPMSCLGYYGRSCPPTGGACLGRWPLCRKQVVSRPELRGSSSDTCSGGSHASMSEQALSCCCGKLAVPAARQLLSTSGQLNWRLLHPVVSDAVLHAPASLQPSSGLPAAAVAVSWLPAALTGRLSDSLCHLFHGPIRKYQQLAGCQSRLGNTPKPGSILPDVMKSSRALCVVQSARKRKDVV